MKKLGILVSGVLGASSLALPAFAQPFQFIWCLPHGAPAPSLAAGIPAFLALFGLALVAKFYPRVR